MEQDKNERLRARLGRAAAETAGTSAAVVDDRTPHSVLRFLSLRTGTTRDAERVSTGRALGMSLPNFTIVGGGCPHVGQVVECSVQSDVVLPTTVVDLEIGNKTYTTVQDALLKLETIGQERTCPQCEHESKDISTLKPVAVKLHWDQGTPASFFVNIVSGRLATEEWSIDLGPQHSYVVKFFGAWYALCGVVYCKEMGSLSEYPSKLFMEEGWWLYNDRIGGNLEHLDNFDYDEYSGTEKVLMYVREDLVEARFGRQVLYRGAVKTSTDDVSCFLPTPCL